MDGRMDADGWIDRALKVKITKEKFKNENLEGSLTLLKDTVLQTLDREHCLHCENY